MAARRIPKAPPLAHPTTQRLLETLAQSLARVAEVSDQANPHLLTVEHLRELDRHERRDAAALPAWLADAHDQAQAELADWIERRGLPVQPGAPDPGEPGPSDHQYPSLPQPVSATAERRLIEFLKCRSSSAYFIDTYVRIRHPQRGVIAFHLWPWQAWLLTQWQTHRICIMLKARQLGASELATAFVVWRVRFYDTQTCLLLSRGELDAKALLQRALGMLAHLPPWLHPGADQAPDACRVENENTRLYQLAHLDAKGVAHTSLLESLPATKGTGRSRTASLVVLDEWAHQVYADAIWGAIEPTIDAGGQLLGISTANGVGNVFHRVWQGATEGLGSVFPVFLSWRRHPERDAAWYAQKLAEYTAANKLHLLHQEYPDAAIEAFVQSGRPVFDQALLVEHEARIRAEAAARLAAELVPWVESEGQTLFEPPEPGHHYILGADVAEGLERGDYDDASVLDRATGREVAALHGRWPIEVYARKLDALGRLYNNALLAVERNNHGHAVLLALTSGLAHPAADGLPKRYPNLYHHQEPLDAGQRPQPRPGWPTTMVTKPLAISALAHGLREGSYLPRALGFLDEALTFAYQDNGSMSAPQGAHDDRIISRMITVYLLAQPDHVEHVLSFMRQLKDQVQQQRQQHAAHSLGAPPGTIRSPAPPGY